MCVCVCVCVCVEGRESMEKVIGHFTQEVSVHHEKLTRAILDPASSNLPPFVS